MAKQPQHRLGKKKKESMALANPHLALSDTWYSIKQTCKILNVSPRTLLNHCDEELIIAHKPVRAKRFNKVQVDDYLRRAQR